MNKIKPTHFQRQKKMLILWLMSDRTVNYVNKQYWYAKLLRDFQKPDAPMRHLAGQGDSLIEWRRNRQCRCPNPTLQVGMRERGRGSRSAGVSLITQVSSPKLVLLPSCNFHNVHVLVLGKEKLNRGMPLLWGQWMGLCWTDSSIKSHFTLSPSAYAAMDWAGINSARSGQPVVNIMMMMSIWKGLDHVPTDCNSSDMPILL